MKRILEHSRYMILLAVISSLFAAAAAFLLGTWRTAMVLTEIVRTDGKGRLISVSLIELMDKFLIAAGLYIFAVGLYEIFLGDLQLPKSLTVHSLHEIKGRLSAIIILVMAIVFLEHVVEWQDPRGTMYFAIAISLVSLALLAFNYVGKRE
jgi:uncharacterized membrane protein YqhA